MIQRRRVTLLAALAFGGLVATAATASAVIPVQTGPIGWTSQDGTSADEYSYRLAAAPSGGVYMGGATLGNFPGEGTTGTYDCALARYDKLGNPLWHRQILSDNECDIWDIASSANGDVVGAAIGIGMVDGTATSAYDGLVVKFDKNGNRKWTRRLSSTGNDGYAGVALAPSGNVYAVGYIGGNAENLTPQGRDVVVVKYDKNGTLKWIKNFGTAANEEGADVAVGPNEDLYITGYGYGNFTGEGYLGDADGFVLKLDKNGVEKGRVRLASTGDDIVTAIDVTKQDGVRVVGYTQGQMGATANVGVTDGFIAAYNLDLTSKWLGQYGTTDDDFFEGVALVKGVTYVTGRSNGSMFGTNQGNADAIVMKLDAAGTAVWGRQFGTGQWDHGTGIVVRSTNANGGGLVIGMDTEGTTFGQTSAGGYDFLLIALPK